MPRRDCGALARLLPEVDRLWGVPQRADYHPEVDTGAHLLLVLDMAARLETPLPGRFAALTHDLGKATTPPDVLPRHIGHEARGVPLIEALCQRLRVPADCREVAVAVAREHTNLHRLEQLRADTVVKVLERCDAVRRPQRFEQMLLACEADYRGRLGWADKPFSQGERWRSALAAARSVDAGGIARECRSAQEIADKVGRARVIAVSSALNIRTP